MTPLEEARARKTTIWGRYKQAREAMKEARDPAERRRQQDRARILQAMYKEADEEVKRLDPGYTAKKAKTTKTGAPMGKALDIVLQNGTLWSDLEGESWSRLEGRTWADVENTSGRNAQILARMIADAIRRCTPLQQQYIKAYYADYLTVADIAEDYGVNPGTVSRVIHNGLRRIEQYVTAKLLLPKCIDGEGRFDYFLFVNSAQVLTERQKELIYLMLAQDTSYTDMARYVGRDVSVVCRTADRVEQRLRGLAVELDVDLSAVTVRREDWAGRSEKELAQDLGLRPMFWYRTVRRADQVDGIPVAHYVILRQLRAGAEPREAAGWMGCSVNYIKKVERQYRGRTLPDAELEEYRPRQPKRTSLPENPFVLISGGDAIIDRIDGGTYLALRSKFWG